MHPSRAWLILLLCCAFAACANPAAGGEASDAETAFRQAMTEGIRFAREGGEEANVRAVARFKEAIRLQPRNAEAHYRLALAYLDMNSHIAAGEHAEAATLLQPDFAPAWLVLGSSLFYRDQEEKAIEKLEKAFKLDPHSAHAAYMLGRCHYYRSGGAGEEARANLRKAIEYFRTAARLDGSNTPARFMEGVCWLDLNMPQVAADYLLLALKGDPTNPEILFRLALCAARMGKHLDAERLCRDTLRYNPSHAEAHLLLGDLFRDQLVDKEEAGLHYRRFLEYASPGHPERERVETWIREKAAAAPKKEAGAGR